jgi:hypothetical protein
MRVPREKYVTAILVQRNAPMLVYSPLVHFGSEIKDRFVPDGEEPLPGIVLKRIQKKLLLNRIGVYFF